jgi:RNA polymerase sigma-70 factor (ECF subfamily)
MVNEALNQLRKKNIIYSSMDIHELDTVPEIEIEEDGVIAYLEELDGAQILELLYLLPDKYRIVLNLFAIDGLKHSEIAEKLGISIDLSKKMVSRARLRLTEIVKTKQNGHEEIRYPSAK